MKNTIKTIFAVTLLLPLMIWSWKTYEKSEVMDSKIDALQYMNRTGYNYVEIEYLGHDYGYRMRPLNTKFKIKSIRPDGKKDYGDLIKVGNTFYYKSIMYPTVDQGKTL